MSAGVLPGNELGGFSIVRWRLVSWNLLSAVRDHVRACAYVLRTTPNPGGLIPPLEKKGRDFTAQAFCWASYIRKLVNRTTLSL